jgi:molybdopterin synthase sulfur carrier subunit
MPTIKLFANLRKIAETKEVLVAPPSGMLRSGSRGTSLGKILNELIKEVPALDGVILEDGQIRPHFVITINGHNVAELDVTVTEQDLIAIFPPIAGG